MSERYQMLTTLGWDRTSVKNFKFLNEAKEHFESIKQSFKNREGFREFNEGNGFAVDGEIQCELVDNDFDLL